MAPALHLSAHADRPSSNVRSLRVGAPVKLGSVLITGEPQGCFADKEKMNRHGSTVASFLISEAILTHILNENPDVFMQNSWNSRIFNSV